MAFDLFNMVLNRPNNLSNITYTYLMRIIIARLAVWLKHLHIVVSIFVSKLMKYSSKAAPIYASWAIDTDIYYEKNSTLAITAKPVDINTVNNATLPFLPIQL
jgi:hypothetical protein